MENYFSINNYYLQNCLNIHPEFQTNNRPTHPNNGQLDYNKYSGHVSKQFLMEHGTVYAIGIIKQTYELHYMFMVLLFINALPTDSILLQQWSTSIKNTISTKPILFSIHKTLTFRTILPYIYILNVHNTRD